MDYTYFFKRILNFLLNNRQVKIPNSQKTLIYPISAAGIGLLVYLFRDEHPNTAPLSCRVRLYVTVRFAMDVQLSISLYTMVVFPNSSWICDVLCSLQISSKPCGLPTFAEHDRFTISCSTVPLFEGNEKVGFSALAARNIFWKA